MDLAAAYRACERNAADHYENFPVASLLLPAAMRPHVAAVYAFARAADDLADEGDRAARDRERLLDGWLARLRACVDEDQPGPPAARDEPDHAPAVFLALGATIRTHSLPLPLFEDLISAFRQDVRIVRYDTWADLFDYCRRSANPVGRLVLRIAGRAERFDAWSDAICTALQLTNFWQDLRVDFERGRVYVPREEFAAHGAGIADLGAACLPPAWRETLAACVSRTRALFDSGRPLCDAVDGRLRYDLRATWLGGRRILDRIEVNDFDALNHRPRLSAADDAPLLWQLATWTGATSGHGGRG